MEGQRGARPPMQKPSAATEQLVHGQQMEGRVTKVTEFGAFVDIGAGRDGMVHISELQPGRVQKVSDVVHEGQQVVVWVKNIDSAKNRISLTMVDPGRKRIQDLTPGSTVEGTVTRLVPYGAFIDLGVEREGMLHVREMAEGYVEDPASIVKPGQTVSVRILSVDLRRHRIDLSLKPEPVAVEMAARPAVREESAADPAAVPAEEEDAPTFMEMAMQQALERRERRERKERKRRERMESREERWAYREEQEEILSRTLERHRDTR